MLFIYRLYGGDKGEQVCRKERNGRKKGRERVKGMYFEERKDGKSKIKMLDVIHYIVLCVFS